MYNYFYTMVEEHSTGVEDITRFNREPFTDFCMKTLGLSEEDAKKTADENFYYTLEEGSFEEGSFVPSENLKKFIEHAENFCVDESVLKPSYNRFELGRNGEILYNWGYFPDNEANCGGFENMMRFLFLTNKNKKRENAFIRVIDKDGNEYNYFDLLKKTKPGEKLKYKEIEYEFPMDYRLTDKEKSHTVIRTNIDHECDELFKLISSDPLTPTVVEKIGNLIKSNKTFEKYIKYIRQNGPNILVGLYFNASNIQKRLYNKLLQYEGTNIEKLVEVYCTIENINYMTWKNADKLLV